LNTIELKANIRKTTGNGPARALRRQGLTPAILYGRNTEPIMLSVNTNSLENVLKNENIGQALFNLVIKNGKTIQKTAMIKELQTMPVSDTLIHVDFYEVAMDRKIVVSIPVVVTGKSKGVEVGGVLQVVRRELEVLCYPGEIPESIEIDITNLEIGDSVHVDEIPLSENIELADEGNFTILTVVSPHVEEEEVEEEEEELEELSEEEQEEEAGADGEA